VRSGGHDVPEPTIRRRFSAGLRNLLKLYIPLADAWQLFDNSSIEELRYIAAGGPHGAAEVFDQPIWSSLTALTQL
jgi:predicted ABC-type ATPase